MRTHVVRVVLALAVLISSIGLAAPASAATLSVSQYEAQIASLVNSARADAGLSALTVNVSIRTVARTWSGHMASSGSFEHNPNYASQMPSGWTHAAENIAYGATSAGQYPAATIHTNLMNSSGHRANILSPHATHMGVGVAFVSRGGLNYVYVTEDFGEYPPGTLGPDSAAIEKYVTEVYRDLFNRGVDASGLATWTRALNSGTPRVAVANAITGSSEYRGSLIQQAYQTYLGRAAEPAGLASWLRQMRRGYRISEMEAGFLASNEYYQKAGATPSGWVRALYLDVLGRAPTGAEVSTWTGRMSTMSRFEIARGFLLSTEHLSAVVDAYYVALLGRHLDPTGRQTWVHAIQRGARRETIIGSIVASAEYFAKAQG